jgi:hypothetical protein
MPMVFSGAMTSCAVSAVRTRIVPGSCTVTFYFLKRTILFVNSGCWTNVNAILA